MRKFLTQRRHCAKLRLAFLFFLCVFASLRENRFSVNAQTTDRIQREAHEFRLEDVRLLDGPFKNAMMRDAAYLLRLDPDRLLSGFRKEAGLKPKAEAYGGWESMTIAGHSLGHYLSACALMFASTGDVRFRDRVNYIVDELETCQRANGNGYVAAIPNGKKIFQEVSAGDIRVKPFDLNGGWVPWYTLHKLFAGLLDVNQYVQNTKALGIAVKLGDWAGATVANLSEEQFQHMLGCEHGGMNEVLAELYARTSDEKYLKLSRRFHHKAVLEPLAQREDRLQGLHANTQIPKLIGLARRYELTADADDKTAAEFFWERVVVEREANYRKELERLKRLEALTIDFVQPGETEVERGHNMQGEKTENGENSGRKWRHARDGGWLSFDLKVLPDRPVSLVASYWGSETGARKFDILVDGTKIGSQSLQNDKPCEFFDVTYAIPPELTRGKNKITIRFAAQPGNIAGGFYGLRIIRHE